METSSHVSPLFTVITHLTTGTFINFSQDFCALNSCEKNGLNFVHDPIVVKDNETDAMQRAVTLTSY